MITQQQEDRFSEIWAVLQSHHLLELLRDLDPQPHGERYVVFRCPKCGRREAYVYPSKDGRGPLLHCNRRNNCEYESTLWAYLKEQHRGDGGSALHELATLINLDLGAGRVVSRRERQRREVELRFTVPPIAGQTHPGNAESAVCPMGSKPSISSTSLGVEVGAGQSWRKQLTNLRPLAGSPGEEYLSGRGIPLQIAHKAGVRYAPAWRHWQAEEGGRWQLKGMDRRIVFPFRNEAGQIVAIFLRAIDGQYIDIEKLTRGEKRNGVYATPGAWEAERLTVTEAAIDALSLYVAGVPSIAIGGAHAPPAWVFDRCAFRPVALATDADQAGDLAAAKLEVMFNRRGSATKRLRPPTCKDWNAELQALGADQMLAWLKAWSATRRLFSSVAPPETSGVRCHKCGALLTEECSCDPFAD